MTQPWKTLATAPTAEGTLDLLRRGEKDYLITIGGRVLMSSAAHRSEDALAKLACDAMGEKKRPRVLVSGLGMGYTLRGALDALPADAAVVVAELNTVVAEWCEGLLGPLSKFAVRDPRVTMKLVDVAKLIASTGRDPTGPRFDAILLDMYEGPQSNVRPGDTIYGLSALQKTKAALSAGGIFAVWCEGPSAGFERGLKTAGFSFELQRVGRGSRTHHVYLSRVRPAPRTEQGPGTSKPRRPGPASPRDGEKPATGARPKARRPAPRRR
jgi:spermidine synthase